MEKKKGKKVKESAHNHPTKNKKLLRRRITRGRRKRKQGKEVEESVYNNHSTKEQEITPKDYKRKKEKETREERKVKNHHPRDCFLRIKNKKEKVRR